MSTTAFMEGRICVSCGEWVPGGAPHDCLRPEVPHRCPVCEGRGEVHAGFYTGGVSTSTAPVTCAACSGSGVLWR